MITDAERSWRRGVLLTEMRDDLVPALLSGPGFERHQIVVRRRHVEIVLPHAEAARRDVRAAARLPEVVPELAAVAGVDGPGVVGCRQIQRAVDHEGRRFDRRRRPDWEFTGAFAADDQSTPAAPPAA